MFGTMYGGGGMYGGQGRRGNDDNGGMFLIMLVAILTWVISNFGNPSNISVRAYVADRDGALITGKPSKLASALLKISGTMKRIPTRDLREVEGMNAFFIVPCNHRRFLNKPVLYFIPLLPSG